MSESGATRAATTATPPAPAAAAAPAPRSGHATWQRAGEWARGHAVLLVLALVPFAVFGLPVLAGRAVLDGDNLIQNFPLRVLVGRDLSGGSLPLWNSYLFSGTPLLGGFNAGAAYPATWLMAVLPVFTAWALAFAAVYDAALVGMYLFLRRLGTCRAAATFGAATYAFSGFMTAQLVHVDLVQGAAPLPWMLLAAHVITEQPGPAGRRGAPARRRARFAVALLAVAFGLAILSGGVEAAIDGAVLLGIYAAARLLALARRNRRHLGVLGGPVVRLLAGIAGAAALGAAQWLPGAAFVAQSQRAGSSYTFFTSGSLPERLLTLIVSPFVLGTRQDRPAYYAGPYNFEEVTGYVGILALIAACVLLTRRWRHRPEARHWWVWYVVLVFGLLSAIGNQTFFGRFLYLVPVLDSQRLLSRNLLLVDCSLAVLLGWWSHLLLTDRAGVATVRTPIRARWRPGGRAELIATCVPVAVSALLCLFLWVAGPLLYHFLEAPFPVDDATLLRLAPLVTGVTLVAVAATWIVLAEARFSAKVLGRLLAAVLVTDLVLFNAFVIRPPVAESQALARTPAAAAFGSLVGDGRFIVFDPEHLYGDQLLELGQTDLNVLNRLPSAQGYTALTDGEYYRATGAHLQEDLDPATLAGPVWDDLNVTTLLSSPGYFTTPAPGVLAPTGIQFPAGAESQVPPGADGPFRVAPGAARNWYLGGVLSVARWSFALTGGSPAGIRVAVRTPSGGLLWLPGTDLRVTGTADSSTLEVSLPAAVPTGGVVLQAGAAGAVAVGAPTAVLAGGGAVRLDGAMQTVAPPHWAFSGAFGPFGVFHNTRSRGWAWLAAPAGGPAAAGSTVTSEPPGPGGGQDITVHATAPVVVDRSQSWSPGWHATVEAVRAGTPARPSDRVGAAVVRAGVVQRVVIRRAGDYRLTFAYSPTAARVGILVSAAAAVALLLWGAVELAGRRSRRRRVNRG